MHQKQKVEIASRNGAPEVPTGWGCDAGGRPTTSSEAILGPGGGLMPLGGLEQTGSLLHKFTICNINTYQGSRSF